MLTNFLVLLLLLKTDLVLTGFLTSVGVDILLIILLPWLYILRTAMYTLDTGFELSET